MIWDRFRMAMEVVDTSAPEGNFNDPLIGSGSATCCGAARATTSMSGGAGGDIYVFARGDGRT